MPAQLQTDQRVMVKGADGVSLEQLRPRWTPWPTDYPTSKVQDIEEIQESQTEFFTQVLGFVLVLLALSVLIGFLGIAITLALSVIERTRELGLLRAVGMNRSQVWAMVQPRVGADRDARDVPRHRARRGRRCRARRRPSGPTSTPPGSTSRAVVADRLLHRVGGVRARSPRSSRRGGRRGSTSSTPVSHE